MNTPDLKSRDLKPGTRLCHVLGGEVVLARRKDDDTGWWNEDGSGLADHALDDASSHKDWSVIGPT